MIYYQFVLLMVQGVAAAVAAIAAAGENEPGSAT